MHSRKSPDNGMTWGADETTSDVASPLPLQGDPGIQPTYVGDYDYGSAILTKHVTSWVDGRNAINGASQQDAYTDRDLVGFAVTTTTPACNSIISTQPTDFMINLTDPVNTASVQANDFTVNAIPANSFVLGGGNTHDHIPLQQLAGERAGSADDEYCGRRIYPPIGQCAQLRVQLHVLLRHNAANGDYDCAAQRRHVLTASAWQLQL